MHTTDRPHGPRSEAARTSPFDRSLRAQNTRRVSHYADELTLAQARRLYFDANGFGEGGYEAAWVKLKAGPLSIYFPNTKSRVRSVRLHDLHHVLTEYETTWTGESEIAAWEIGGGCGDHWAAWLLNFNAVAIGLAIAPRAVLRAFVRGRRGRNLYASELDPRVLAETLGVMRERLGLTERAHGTSGDLVRFAEVALVSIVVFAASAVLPLLLTVAAVLAFVTRR